MAHPETPAARLRALRQRWEADRTSRVFLQLAEEYRRQGMPSEALRVLEEGLRHHAASIAGQVALGRCRLELGQAEGAAAILEKVVERDPTQMVAYRTLVDAYVRLGAATEARDRLAHYIQLNPQDLEIENLGLQIEELDRAAAALAPEAAPLEPMPEEAAIVPELSTADPAPLAEAERADSSNAAEAAESAPATEEMVAVPWPAAPPPPEPPSGAWSGSTTEPAWISPPSVAFSPSSSPLDSPTTKPPASSRPEEAADAEASTHMFRVTNAPWEAAPDPVPTDPTPEADDDQADDDPATESLAASEFETVFFDLRQVASIANDSPSHPEQQAEPRESLPTGEIEDPSGSLASLEPELAPRDETPPASAKSWSIGESEIVFSLPALPRLRALVDLSAVPWRPVGPPAWSRRDGGVPSSPILVAPASPMGGTPTLAQLYLDQGHADEAAELYGEVLRRDPDNEVARAGMDRVERERGTVDARSLLRGFEPAAGGGLSSKQAYVLRRWATLVRQAHRRDAP
ncbi:MAG TPA: tetratricopeptide repeat protein [Thermoanaerobaculia bacterium]|nr:tetratricopeptide repeat protein [Thermoanaerobaculia bacterium]